jgi:hypothetical protein
VRVADLFLAAAVVAGALAGASGASAASFAVNDTTDAALSNSAGTTCASTDAGKCTLRAAVQAPDNTGGSNTITLPAGVYKLTIDSTGVDDPSAGDLDIKSGVSVTVTGAGASSTTINANYIDRAFAVQHTASLSISRLTIKHGVAGESAPSSNSTDSGSGGAFYNDGSLSIRCQQPAGQLLVGRRGAVYSDSDATATSITNSTGTGNTADDPGAIAEVSAGTATMTGDTFTHNAADGGGVLDSKGSTVTISNSGVGAATSVTFTDTLPAGSSYYSSSSSQGLCIGTGTVTCSLGAIDSASTSGSGAAGSATVTIVVIPSHAGTFKDTASASASNAPAASGSASTKLTPAPSLPVAVTGVASQVKSTRRRARRWPLAPRCAASWPRSRAESREDVSLPAVAVNANGTFNGNDAKFTTKKKAKKKKHHHK